MLLSPVGFGAASRPRGRVWPLAVVGLVVAWSGLVAGCEQAGEAGTASGGVATADVGGSALAPTSDQASGTPDTPDPATPDEGAPATAPVELTPPQVVFDPPLLDFGYILPNEDAVGTVQIRNVGPEPVKILRATPTCQCTTLSDLAGVVLAPGQSVPMTAKLDGRSVTGSRTASVRFLFEGYQPLRVDVKAVVALPVKTIPTMLNLNTGERVGHVVIESVDEKPFNILATNRTPPRFVGFDPELDEPRRTYVLEWDLSEYAEEDLPRWWVIETDHPDCPVLDAWVRHRATIDRGRGRAWRVEDRRVLLGRRTVGEPIEFSVTVKKLGTDSIYAVRSLDSDFDAELVKLERRGAEARCTVRLTPKPDLRGLLFGRIEFIASTHTQKIDVVGKLFEEGTEGLRD
ncbi:MAG: DUF1573 domain-containing protein [Planctomycetota bacterium]|jgi:hypothetical protein